MNIRICFKITLLMLCVALAPTLAVAKSDTNIEGMGAIVSRGEVDIDVVRRMYLGQQRNYIAVNLPEGNEARERFEQQVIGRSPAQMKAHWSRLVFTGRAWELNEFRTDEEVVTFVRSNDNGIGYISDASKANGLYIIEYF